MKKSVMPIIAEEKYTSTNQSNPSMQTPTLALFLVIVLEGYVVLSTELLAIRQTIPYVGSSTDTVAIIIAAVLMPLAFGYSAGGQFRPGFTKRQYRRVRDRLVNNIIIAMIFLLFGLSYPLLSAFFIFLIDHGLSNRHLLTASYALLFLICPVYLLGQTVPLVSNYFSRERLARITGKILFFSTLGSFLGAILTTLVLMSILGVHHTVAILFLLLSAVVFILCRRKLSWQTLVASIITVTALGLNSDYTMGLLHIVEDNTYNTIMATETDGVRHLYLNNNSSSLFTADGRKHDYIEFVESVALQPLAEDSQPKEILVIGAGGFTFGFQDTHNLYDFLDIDSSLKEIAEKHLLKARLSANKTFFPVPARAYLAGTRKKYDVIFMDVFQGDLTIPEHLVTREYFQQIKAHLKGGGLMIANIAASPNFVSVFSRTIDNTLRSVFPNLSRHMLYNDYQAWSNDINQIGNAIYIYRDNPDENPADIYTDDRNSVFYDKPKGRSAPIPEPGRIGLPFSR